MGVKHFPHFSIVVYFLAIKIRLFTQESCLCPCRFPFGKTLKNLFCQDVHHYYGMNQIFIFCVQLQKDSSEMSHLFNNTEYFDFRSKFYTPIKKGLDMKIEAMAEVLTQDNLHPIENQDQVVLDGVQFNFLYEGETNHFPLKLLETETFKNIFNIKVIKEEFDNSQIQELLSLVPGKSMQNLQYALEGKGMNGGILQNFQKKIKSGYFSSFRQKQDQINDKLSEYRLRQIYENLFKAIQNQRMQGVTNQRFILEDQGSSVQSLNDFEDIEQMSQNSQATETEEEIESIINEEFSHKVFFKYDYSKIKNQEQLLALGEEKSDKKAAMYKITLPMRPRNSDWVDNYRRQELLRYSNPTKPWIYICEDGRKVTVAPVAKKLSVLTGKPRDHPMLKSERPACVTILTLVRDAAARLPNGVGTRADISQLLKESQYVTEDLPEQKLSNIVSGALDRLHYMADACVKYDAEKKLWIYLHIDRNNEHPGWGEDGEQYTERNPIKRKKMFTNQN